jgi:hypothetical protein
MILFTIGTYLGGTQAFIGSVVYWMYLSPVLFAVIAVLVQKRRQQGSIDFRAALKVCFGVIVLSLALQMLFTWILVHFIDPGFGRTLPPAVLIKTENTYRRFGMPEDEISRNITALQGTDPFSFGSMVLGLARDYIIGFLIALLLAAILGHKKPASAAE